MPANLKSLFGQRIVALDGDAGVVTDFLIDDRSWSIEYLIVRTGTWLKRRAVAIPSIAMGPVRNGAIPVSMSMAAVRMAPDAKSAACVSGRYLAVFENSQFLPYYWLAGGESAPAPALTQELEDLRRAEKGNGNLRSAREVIGYRVHGLEGDLGNVSDFLVDDAGWSVRQILVRKVRKAFGPFSSTARVSPGRIQGLSWLHKSVTAAVVDRDLKWYRRETDTCRPKNRQVVSLGDGAQHPESS
jgi:sporulation protein YlmC with PRC-barrel domain